METKAGPPLYQGSFLLHYLDEVVYPNLPGCAVMSAGVAICALNLEIYYWRFRKCPIYQKDEALAR